MRIRYKVDWMVVITGLLLITLILGLRFSPGGVSYHYLYTTIFMFGAATAFLSHLALRWRAVFFPTIATVLVTYLVGIYISVEATHLPTLIFLSVFGIGGTASFALQYFQRKELLDGRVVDRPTKDFFLLTTGFALTVFGLSLAAKGLIPGWFEYSDGIVPAGAFFYLIESIIFVLVGG